MEGLATRLKCVHNMLSLQAAVVQFHEQSVQWDTQVRNCLDQLLSAGFTIAPAGRMIPSSKGRNPESNSSPNKDHDMQFSHLQSELLGASYAPFYVWTSIFCNLLHGVGYLTAVVFALSCVLFN